MMVLPRSFAEVDELDRPVNLQAAHHIHRGLQVVLLLARDPQLIAVAGGLQEFADSENIVVLRPSQKNFRGDPFSYRVNYKDITRRRNLQQNIELKPGDTVVVP